MNSHHFPPVTRRSRSPSPNRLPTIEIVNPMGSFVDNGEAHRDCPRSVLTRSSTHLGGSDRRYDMDNQQERTEQNCHLQGGCLQPPCSRADDCMRRRLKYFFMNPCDKWKARRRFPWKLCLQLIKVVCVTIQLVIFGFTRTGHVTFLETSVTTFKHLYIKDWDASFETMPYPPSTGKFAIYTIPDFYQSLTYVQSRYYQTETLAIGPYHFSVKNGTAVPVELCVTQYIKSKLQPLDHHFEYNTKKVRECDDLGTVRKWNESAHKFEEVYDVKAFLESKNNGSINFDGLIRAEMYLNLDTIHLKELSTLDTPDCYKFQVKITFENGGHNGQVLVDLDVYDEPRKCNGSIQYEHEERDKIKEIMVSLFDVLVIVISLGSMLLCMRSLYKGQKLKREVVKFFLTRFKKSLSVYDQCEFFNTWYFLIIINDFLTITGSVLKIQIESKDSHKFETCGVLLGTGNLLVWFGVLRYLEFYPKYSILILTMKKSAPSVMRYLVCAGIFYLGFMFCGWVVLGPYHIKFRSLSSASECLFSLVNGDDMFVTFSAIEEKNSYVWWYSQVYLYVFISLFIYVVLSVFISVIMDTYETIKHHYEHGFPKSDLFKFIDECTDHPTSPLYLEDADPSCFSCLKSGSGSAQSCLDKIFCTTCCCVREARDSTEPNETTRLVS